MSLGGSSKAFTNGLLTVYQNATKENTAANTLVRAQYSKWNPKLLLSLAPWTPGRLEMNMCVYKWG